MNGSMIVKVEYLGGTWIAHGKLHDFVLDQFCKNEVLHRIIFRRLGCWAQYTDWLSVAFRLGYVP